MSTHSQVLALSNHHRAYLLSEMVLLFVLVPVLLAMPISVVIKIALVLLALTYILVTVINNLKKQTANEIKTLQFLKQSFSSKLSQLTMLCAKDVSKRIALQFSVFALLSSVYVLTFMPDRFFFVVLNAPLLWSFIVVVYVLLSVLPQEALYRTFFINRYGPLFKINLQHLESDLVSTNSIALILLNASLFSLAHLFFYNALVMLLTFAGGVLFAITYLKQSRIGGGFVLVSIEHSIYGLWLFTIGMGEMLAFPMPQ